MYYKEDWKRTKEHFKAWWNRELDEPIIQVFAPKEGAGIINWDIWGFVKNWRKPSIVIREFEEYCQRTFFRRWSLPQSLDKSWTVRYSIIYGRNT